MPRMSPEQDIVLLRLRDTLLDALNSRQALPTSVSPGQEDAYMQEWLVHLQLRVLADSVLRPAVERVGPDVDRFAARLEAVRGVLDVTDDFLIYAIEQEKGQKPDEDQQQRLIAIGKKAASELRTILEDAITASARLEDLPQPKQ